MRVENAFVVEKESEKDADGDDEPHFSDNH